MDFAMQDQVLSCREARPQIAAYLDGESCPALAAHLNTCAACVEACLETALRRPPAVRVPEHFSNRLLARGPEIEPSEPREFRWAVAGVILFVMFGVALWRTGVLFAEVQLTTEFLRRPIVLLAAGGIEIALSLLWLWRVLIDEP
jgi:hypothetical protein